MRKGRKKPTEGQWVTLRVLYAVLALHPSAMQIRDINKAIDYLTYKKGIDVEGAFALIGKETSDDQSYYRLGLKEPVFTSDREDKGDIDMVKFIYDENGMLIGWGRR
jgi:hypothetical protein